MTFPLIHLNGTKRDALIEEYNHAHDTLEAFKDAFCATTHNARDYYPLGQEAFVAATQERQEIFTHMEAISRHIEAMRFHLYES